MRGQFLNKITLFIVLLLLIQTIGFTKTATNSLQITATVSPLTCPIIHVCFTPYQNCTDKIIGEINQAEHSILVQAYSFTSKSIAEALVEAKKKGVSVKVILDKTQRTQKYSLIHFIVDNGIPVWIDMDTGIAHSKIMIIDQDKVITGSFNFTDSAQKRNRENVVFISNPELAQVYTENWEFRKRVSPLYGKTG